jgi:hypothetical protein
MISATTESEHYLRPPREKQLDELLESSVEEEVEEKLSDDGEFILCRQCLNVITSSAERIEVDGSHQHTFANPHGLVFEIGCFRTVIGCGYAGPASDDFTWFAGYSWRVAVCFKCLTHLGWQFTSTGLDRFNGLILDRLVDQKE